MANKKKEVEESKKAGESIVAQKFADKSTSNPEDTRSDMYSMDYEQAKAKYGTKGQGNNVYFMSKDQFDKAKNDYNAKKAVETPKEQTKSLVADKFADKPQPKSKTWNDVKTENGNDPSKIADYLNNNPDYKAGDLTKQGMADMGYSQDKEGKWTTNDVLDKLDEISADTPEVGKAVNDMTNPETGEVDTAKANSAVNSYEKALVELGAGEYDKNGNFVLKPTSKAKGWETWATMLSCGLSVIGIAMGVPILPINFRAITGKDSRDAQIQSLQQQYMNIKSNDASKVTGMNADVEAGTIAGQNKEALRNQEEHTQNMGAYKTKADIDTEGQLQVIDKQAQHQFEQLKAQLNSNEKIQRMQLEHAKDMAKLQSDLSTASAKQLTEYAKAGWVTDYIKECKAQGLSNKDIALAIAGINGTTPTQVGLQNAQSIVNMVDSTANAAANIVGAANPVKIGK